MSNLGKRLREVREQKKLSIYEVEKRTGLHFSTISKYERNERTPSLSKLMELARAYQVPAGALITKEEDLLAFLPDDLINYARVLQQRRELLTLVELAGRLTRDQVGHLNSLLRSLSEVSYTPSRRKNPPK